MMMSTARKRAKTNPGKWLGRMAKVLGIAALAFGAALPARAQSFAPVITVNDSVITGFELDQRVQFLQLLNAPGNLEETAREALINERLQVAAAKQMGIETDPDALEAGMTEFAGRANMSTEEFIKAIGQAGIAKETFESFVEAGVIWRDVVRARFAPRIRISEAEIDRALELTQPGSGVRVLLSEIVLPADTPENKAIATQRAAELAEIKSFAAFEEAAKSYSASRSGPLGGKLDWSSLSDLPPPVRAQILPLSPGDVTEPLPVQNAIVLFQLRAISETDARDPVDASLDYAAYFIPGGRSEAALADAAKVRAEVDTCDDLYAIAKGLPEEQLVREVHPMSQIPTDYARELAKLDAGESSTALTSADGSALVFLMLCGRTQEMPEDISRDDIRRQLFNERISSYADGYLAELLADAHIEELN